MYKINKQFFRPENQGLDLFNMYSEGINNKRHLIVISKNINKNTDKSVPDNEQNIEAKNIELINKLGVLAEDRILANLELTKNISKETSSSYSSSVEIEPLEEIKELVSLLL